MMWPLAILSGLLRTHVLAMHMDTFLQAFNRLGLIQWDGIEQDIAWGHVTSLVGLSRPGVEGPFFIYKAPCLIGGQSFHRVRLMATTNSRPEPLLMEIACHFEDLANPVQFEPWRLLALIPLEEGREIGATIPATSLLTSVPFDNQFFLSGCCMAQRRSLSGRSPFCQRKLSDSRKFNGNFVP